MEQPQLIDKDLPYKVLPSSDGNPDTVMLVAHGGRDIRLGDLALGDQIQSVIGARLKSPMVAKLVYIVRWKQPIDERMPILADSEVDEDNSNEELTLAFIEYSEGLILKAFKSGNLQ